MWPEPSNTPLQDKIFRSHYDRLLETGSINPDILGYMDRYQQRAVNELKKAMIRIKKRYDLQETIRLSEAGNFSEEE